MTAARIRLAMAATAVMLAAACAPQPHVHAGEPTATQAQRALGRPIAVKQINGVVSWYDATRNNAWYTRQTKWGAPVAYYAAAGPAARKLIGDKNPYHEHYPVYVTNRKTGRTIKVIIVDWCQCSKGKRSEKAIDLSPAAFQALGLPLGHGVMRVTITLLP